MRSASAAMVFDGFSPIAFGHDRAVGDEQVPVSEDFALVVDDPVGRRAPMLQPPSGCGVMRSRPNVHVSGVSGMPPVARASCSWVRTTASIVCSDCCDVPLEERAGRS